MQAALFYGMSTRVGSINAEVSFLFKQVYYFKKLELVKPNTLKKAKKNFPGGPTLATSFRYHKNVTEQV